MSNIYGQKTELRVSLNSGLFSFSGQSAAENSQINLYDQSSNTGYTNDPYGSKNGFCYGVSLNLKRVTKSNVIYGIDFGYETLRSKVSIQSVNGFDGTSPFAKNASGQTFLNINSLNLNPSVGYRFNINKFPLDLVGGFDIGYILKAREIGNATDMDGIEYSTSLDRKTINYDFRPRVQISTDYKKFGLYLGYSIGLSNYLEGYIGGVNEAYSRMMRFGITYKLK
ncbi:outer membrane beta-barrel protein [Flavobacterium sp. M31R6]|uniref:outer membrane beta-barrel protein n=1 Tax=Flavobacterium sp. M31R6 TaxID=2739062 RepID=UPI0015699580|nr:outer membrane beta-barrel protein [Flavobacterium sp. M31R6]QKJ61910.1 outer membrane beta-barrel protein [Flavobacterium sp. M31R6]